MPLMLSSATLLDIRVDMLMAAIAAVFDAAADAAMHACYAAYAC